MRRLFISLSYSALCLAVCLTVSGCSGSKVKKYKVGGKLTKGGQPLKPKETGRPAPPSAGGDTRIRMQFYKIEEGKPRPADPSAANIDGKTATVDGDGNFRVPDGLVAGKYVVTVQVRGSGGSGDPDEFKGKYNFKNSQVLVDVNEDKEDLALDLDKVK